MTPEELSLAIHAALKQLVADGKINVDLPDEVRVERPKNRDHGDWATNIALQLGKRAGMAPREFAELLTEAMAGTPGIAKTDIAGPGFINFTLDTAAAAELVRTIVTTGSQYGSNTHLQGQRVNLEFVSANPTGPLHIGHTRWAALGDAIGRVMKASGADVVREYYINDAGSQMNTFAESIYRQMHDLPVQEGGYPGSYIKELGNQIKRDHPDVVNLTENAALPVLREHGYKLQLKEIQDTLEEFDVHFDVWFSEQELHSTGAIETAIERLREQGHVFDHEGAVWLRTTDFGDDKDRVLIRANGEPTYFAADAAYYLSKKDRGFERKVYLLGADHHGYVNRLKAIAACAGEDKDVNIEVLIGQLISVDGAKLSKRAGNIIELKDLIQWLGADALRYSLARFPADSPISIDPELLKSNTNDNPVFYVQYAHARSRTAARNAEAAGVSMDTFEAATLNHPAEEELISTLARFPQIVAMAGEFMEPHRVARYLEELAAAYHSWYGSCRIVPRAEEELAAVNHSRLWLNEATSQVLANGLELLGVSAPERM